MQEKIKELATEKFHYHIPDLKISKSPITFDVSLGEEYTGEFDVFSSDDSEIKGVVLVDSESVVFKKDTFYGKENHIVFTFLSKNYFPGDVVRGMFQILSDIGTAFIPFTVNITLPVCKTEDGTLRDLYHFANYAQHHYKEAVHIFQKPDFEKKMLGGDEKKIILYRELCGAMNKAVAMEEFLVSVHKKLPVKLSSNRVKYDLLCHQSELRDSVEITRDHWGYIHYDVATDVPFLTTEVETITKENFHDNKFLLNFHINPDKLISLSKNEGRIIIRDSKQEIVIHVSVECVDEKRESRTESYLQRKLFGNIIQIYLDFVCNKITEEEYFEALEQCYSKFFAPENEFDEWNTMNIIQELYRIYLALTKHKTDKAKSMIQDFSLMNENLKRENLVLFSFYQYLLAKAEPEELETYRKVIRECYDQKGSSDFILWCLLETDSSFYSEERQFELLKKQIVHGSKNPVIYQKICTIYNNNPFFLQKLTKENHRALHWGAREGYLNKDIALKYAFYIGLAKTFHMQDWTDLCKMYEKFPENEILETICSLLICGQKTSSEAFKWYTLGVKNNLKLADLYEYYMYSIDSDYMEKLPQNVLLYFLYDNHLSADRKAVLYATIIKNKENDHKSYEVYGETMKRYLMEELEKKHINNSLAVLYEEFLTEDMVNAKSAPYVPQVMFRHEVICKNNYVKGIYVHHYGMAEDEFSLFRHGKAQIDLYSDKDQIFLVDAQDNRYAKSIDYTINKIVHLDSLALSCMNYHSADYGLLFNLYSKVELGEISGKQAIVIKQKLLKLEGLEDNFRKGVFSSMIRNYYEEFEGNLLDQTLKELDWDDVLEKDRNLFIEYCAIRHFYNKAMEGIVRFGYGKISEKRLLQISSPIFQKATEKKDLMVKLAWHIFESGNFDSYMLAYLCKYYIGTVGQMIRIWKTASAFRVDTAKLPERIMTMCLFTGEMSADVYDIFYIYKNGKHEQMTMVAFLNWISYRYVVKNIMVPVDLFDDLMEFHSKNDVMILALLKYFSKKEELTEEEKTFVQEQVGQLYERHMFFAFYKSFAGKVSLPEKVLNGQYVQYTANPENEVCIHYTIETNQGIETEKTETMKNIFGGIHVKEFLLFQDEKVTYNFTEYTKKGERRSAESYLTIKGQKMQTEQRYSTLNRMMQEKEDGHDLEAIDGMKEYVLQNTMSESLFHTVVKSSNLITKISGEESVGQNGRKKYTSRS